MSLLTVKDLEVNYGGIRALRGISFHVEENEIVSIIGANGAGKSTTLNAIAGIIAPAAGDIFFKEKPINGISPYVLVKQGIAQTPEGRQIFSELTVEENLKMGGYTKDRHRVEALIREVYEMFPILRERRSQMGGTLSGGEQQMLALGRSLISEPKLLMLDEPSLGLAPLVVKSVLETIPQIRKKGTSVILVEQNARMALKISDRGYVLENGRIIAEGKSQELLNDENVLNAYLGEEKELKK